MSTTDQFVANTSILPEEEKLKKCEEMYEKVMTNPAYDFNAQLEILSAIHLVNPRDVRPVYQIIKRSREAQFACLAYHWAIVGQNYSHPKAIQEETNEEAKVIRGWRIQQEYMILSYYMGKRELALALGQKLLLNDSVPWPERDAVMKNLIPMVAEFKDKFLEKFPHQTIKSIQMGHTGSDTVVLTMTTCKRYDLFEKTVISFLNCCTDSYKISDWIIIDDNSSPEDRLKMKQKFPFFTIIEKDETQKSHPVSMNMIRQEIARRYPGDKTVYWFNLEDDWQFFSQRNYVGDAISVLKSDSSIHQCLFNRSYAERLVPQDINIACDGDLQKTPSGVLYRIHGFANPGTPEHQALVDEHPWKNNCFYWPHFSFRPGLTKIEVLDELGEFNTDPRCHFEMDYAYRYAQKGWVTAFFDDICCWHTGRLTSERNDPDKKNAYQLNQTAQFGSA